MFPALYIACAAVILMVALWFQGANPKKTPNHDQATPYTQSEDPAVPVTKSSEVVKMPAAANAEVVVQKKFYEDAATEAEQEKALVFYNNTYSPNKGIDIAAKNGKEFNVAAALSGTVTKAEKDSLLGYVVTVDSGNGVAVSYQSLGSVKVEKGARVAQGEVLGTSGLSAMNKEAGSHVHFEVRKDNVAVNPERYLNKSVTEIKADAGAAKATNASGKKLMTNLKKKRSQRARNQKVKQKTSLKKKRNQQAVQLVTKKKNRRKKKNQQMVLQNHLTILLHKNKKVKKSVPTRELIFYFI